MKRRSYKTESFEKVSVCGIPCNFSDIRIDRSTVTEGRYMYEAVNDEGDELTRIQVGVLVNFFGTLICDEPLPIGEDGTLYVEDGDFVWL